jgi:AmiR/NasT family two-component response regulator
MLIEDWERESFKDFIYLQEEIELLKQEINEEKERLAAKILVIKEEKIREDEKHSVSTIPRTT